jgi:DNA polymerase-3 subunit epsilon
MLIKPATSNYISNKITNLTGITTEMVSDGSEIEDALKLFLEFLEDDIIIGHNVSFDISFLNNKIDSYLDCDFNVDYIDTLYLSREKFPQFNSHKLSFLSQVLNLNKKSSHRALDDCYATLELYELCRSEKSNGKSKIINCTNDFNSVTCCNIEKDNNINGKHFCFTGTMVKLSREEAISKCIGLGAQSDSSVTLKTNFLVMGIQDYAIFADGKESSKTKRAKQLIEKGQDLQIIDENYFINLISLQLQTIGGK